MDINRYMSNSIQNIATTALRYSVRNAQERRFITGLMARLKKSAEIRDASEEGGTHIPPFLIASIASQCNLHCNGCYARAGGACGDGIQNSELTTAQWRSVFHQASELGVSFIMLAGGEPLLREDIIHLAAEYKEITFPIFTNGTLIDATYIGLFDANRNLIPILSIEGDSVTTDNRRGSGVSMLLQKSMEKLAQKKILYGASVTVTNENMEMVTVAGFVQQLKKSGCGIIFYVEYVPTEAGSEYLVLTDAEQLSMDNRVQQIKRRCRDMIVISFPGDEKHMGGCLAAGRGFFHISATGGAEPCPFSPYSDVNVKDSTLLEALHSPLFLRLASEGILSQEHTGGCVLFENRKEVSDMIAEVI